MQSQRVGAVHALLFGLVAAAAWLRLRNLATDSVWLDEAASWLQSSGTLAELISSTARDNYPPLHNLLLFASINLSGSDSEWVLRLPSVLLGVANVAAIYWLGTLIGSRIGGVFAAALLTVSSMHIFYSQEARMYALLALTATLYAASALYFAKMASPARAVLAAVCGLALVYSHPFGTLNWIAIAVGFGAYMRLTSAVPRQGLSLWIIANAAVAIGFLPWAVILLRRADAIAGRFWIPAPTVSHVFGQLLGLTGKGAAGAAFVISVAIGTRFNARAAMLLLGWAIAPIVAALLISLMHTSLIWGRYFIGSLPALAMLAGLGLAHLLSRPQWPAKAAALALLGTVAVGNLNASPWVRDDWRSVAAALHGRLGTADCVLVYPAYQSTPLRYYLRQPVCTVEPRSIEQVDLQGLASRRLFAVVVDSRSTSAEVALLREKLNAFGRASESLRVRAISIVEYTREP